MTITLAELLKDSAYKLTQFKPAQIQALESSITMKDTGKNPAPYVTCLVRGYPKDIAQFLIPFVDNKTQLKIREKIISSLALKRQSVALLEVAKRAVEIAIEQDEMAAISYIEATS